MVYIKGDARVRFESMTDVIDNLRVDGVDEIGLITESVQGKSHKNTL
jgi:biopolymer transport protein ExbD